EIAGGEPLAAAHHVGLQHDPALGRQIDLLHEVAREAEDPAVLLVADLRSFVPGAVDLDHSAVRERDRVGRARPGEERQEQDDVRRPRARHGQGRREAAGDTLGEAPPWRKYSGSDKSAAVARSWLS